MIAILLLISITSAGLYYLYSEDGPIQTLEREHAQKALERTQE